MNLALFDLDNTLLAGDSDYEWAQFLVSRGVLNGDDYAAGNQRYFDQYHAGTLDIREFLDFQLAPLARHPRRQLDAWHAEFMRERILPMISEAARRLVQSRLGQGDLCAIVTATNNFVTAPIAREFGVAHLVATVAEEKNGAFTGKFSGMPCFREGKVTRVQEWLNKQKPGLSLSTGFSRSWFYSDSHNDLALLEQVTDPVGVNPDPALREIAKARGWETMNLH